jgi:hypothetical protein
MKKWDDTHKKGLATGTCREGGRVTFHIGERRKLVEKCGWPAAFLGFRGLTIKKRRVRVRILNKGGAHDRRDRNRLEPSRS